MHGCLVRQPHYNDVLMHSKHAVLVVAFGRLPDDCLSVLTEVEKLI